MENQWKTSFESVGASSYLTVSFPADAPIIGYQLEMITSNEISHFLPVSRRMVNGKTVLYYQISSKLRLSQILGRKKLKREELWNLVQGVKKAVSEGAEYQLGKEGLLLDPELIYVEPDTCSPSFVYLPVERPESDGIRELLTGFVLHGKLEMSQDNFVQRLLEVLNKEPFSFEALEECLKPGKKGAGAGKPVKDAGKPPLVQPNPVSQPEAVCKQASAPDSVPAPMPPKPEPEKKEKGMFKPGLPVPGKEKKAGLAIAGKEKKKKQPEKTEGFDRETAKRKFLLPQAIVLVGLSAMVSFGLFMDEAGKLVTNHILAAVIVVVAFEFILYREVYKKGPAEGKEKKEKREKKEKKEKRTMPGAVNRPAVKAKERPEPPKGRDAGFGQGAGLAPAHVPEVVLIPMPEGGSGQGAAGVSSQGAHPYPDSQKAESWGAEPVLQKEPETQADSSETVLWEDGQGDGAYLEYYVNGIMSRVLLNRPSTFVGRLAGQVDFPVANPKVGKVHAEFLNQNGEIFVVDQNSKNGTYINRSSVRLDSNIPYPLKDGDRVRLADSEFTLRCGFR